MVCHRAVMKVNFTFIECNCSKFDLHVTILGILGSTVAQDAFRNPHLSLIHPPSHPFPLGSFPEWSRGVYHRMEGVRVYSRSFSLAHSLPCWIVECILVVLFWVPFSLDSPFLDVPVGYRRSIILWLVIFQFFRAHG